MRKINEIRNDIGAVREMLTELEDELKEASIVIKLANSKYEEHEKIRHSFMEQVSQLDIDNIMESDFEDSCEEYAHIYESIKYHDTKELKAIWIEVQMCIAYP